MTHVTIVHKFQSNVAFYDGGILFIWNADNCANSEIVTNVMNKLFVQEIDLIILM